MKKAIVTAAIGLAGLACDSAQAGSQMGTFNVSLNLAATCEINSDSSTNTLAIGNDLNLNYTSFQASDSTATQGFSVRCTDTLPYQLTMDATNITDEALNLEYTLNLTTSATYAAGAIGNLGATGTGLPQNYYIHATIPSGQSGKCAADGGGNATGNTNGICSNTASTNRGSFFRLEW